MQNSEIVKQISHNDEAPESERISEIKRIKISPVGMQIIICLIFWLVMAAFYYFVPKEINEFIKYYNDKVNSAVYIDEINIKDTEENA